MDQNYAEVIKAVGQLEGAVKGLCASMERLRVDIHTDHTDHETRLRVLEHVKDKIEGDTAARKAIRGIILTAFGGSIGAAILHALKITPAP